MSPDASVAVAALAEAVQALIVEGIPPVGLIAGERPAADVAALLGLLPRVEAILAMRMARAEAAGALPFMAAGGMAAHRRWSRSRARSLSRAGHLANRDPVLALAWTAGKVTGEHVDAAAVGVTALPEDRASAVLDALGPLWGRTTPAEIRRFCARARAIVDPPDDPDQRAVRARDERYVAFAVLDDTVHITGRLPRLDGELLMNTLRATGESLRVAGDGVTAAQRRADALMVLAAGDATRAPVAVTVTVEGEAATSGGYLLTPGETRLALCDPELTSILTLQASPDPSTCGTAATGPAGSGGPMATGPVGTGPVATGPVATGPVAGGPPSGSPAAGGPPDDPMGRRIPSPRRRGSAGPPRCPDSLPGGWVADASGQSPGAELGGSGGSGGGPAPHGTVPLGAAWALALARLTADTLAAPQPLAVGRTQRIATTAQRRALALRDRGCIMPGCEVPAEHCQIHHCTAWTDGGATDLPNLATLCWAHHREVDLGRWDIHPTTEPSDDSVPGAAGGSATAGALDRPSGSAVRGGTTSGVPADRGVPADSGVPANHGAPFTITTRPRARWGR